MCAMIAQETPGYLPASYATKQAASQPTFVR